LRQIEKDFMLQGIPFSFPEKAINREEIITVLAKYLQTSQLISGQKLPGLLYQLDISENEIAKLAINTPNSHWAETLAEIILFRCFTKVYWRQKMK